MMVSAEYRGKLDKKRDQRIEEAFDRCGVRRGVPMPVMSEAFGGLCTYSDVDWSSNADGTWTGLKIHVDEQERAVRLASELRACGMVVSIGSDDHVDWPEDDEG